MLANEKNEVVNRGLRFGLMKLFCMLLIEIDRLKITNCIFLSFQVAEPLGKRGCIRSKKKKKLNL